jgi:hypothetical protein
MLIKTHKETKQRLLLKKDSGLVSTFYILDDKDNKIQDGYKVDESPYYKVAICLNKNVK